MAQHSLFLSTLNGYFKKSFPSENGVFLFFKNKKLIVVNMAK
jgi:hypothetical protein